MCADDPEAAFARDYPRLYELRSLVPDAGGYTAYFHRHFAQRLTSPGRARAWSERERDLQALDGAAWNFLKEKLRPYLNGLDKHGRGWQQLIEALNEASAYRYLSHAVKCRDIRFVPESKDRTPDLEAQSYGGLVLCETKTISASDEEIRARVEGTGSYSSTQLSDAFLKKLTATIAGASAQSKGYRINEKARRIVFLVLDFDDSLGEYAKDYYAQIDLHLATEEPECELVFFNRHTRFDSEITMKNAVIINE